jgi:hypothetical protein
VQSILNKKILYLIACCITLSLMSFLSFHSEPKYIKLKNRIVADYAKQLRQENGLYLAGGGGVLMHNVKEISLMFACYKQMSVSEARNLYVKVIEGYLQQINQNEAIRPYLDQYPFMWSNMDVQIMFQDANNHFPGEGVAAIFQGKDGIIMYRGHNASGFYHLHSETPEQAIKLANTSASRTTIR